MSKNALQVVLDVIPASTSKRILDNLTKRHEMLEHLQAEEAYADAKKDTAEREQHEREQL